MDELRVGDRLYRLGDDGEYHEVARQSSDPLTATTNPTYYEVYEVGPTPPPWTLWTCITES